MLAQLWRYLPIISECLDMKLNYVLITVPEKPTEQKIIYKQLELKCKFSTIVILGNMNTNPNSDLLVTDDFVLYQVMVSKYFYFF